MFEKTWRKDVNNDRIFIFSEQIQKEPPSQNVLWCRPIVIYGCQGHLSVAQARAEGGALGAQAPALFQNYSSAPLRQIAMIL